MLDWCFNLRPVRMKRRENSAIKTNTPSWNHQKTSLQVSSLRHSRGGGWREKGERTLLSPSFPLPPEKTPKSFHVAIKQPACKLHVSSPIMASKVSHKKTSASQKCPHSGVSLYLWLLCEILQLPFMARRTCSQANYQKTLHRKLIQWPGRLKNCRVED